MEKSMVRENRSDSPADSFSIRVDLGGTNLRAAAYRKQTGIVDSVLLPTRLSFGRDQVVQDMCDAIRTLTERNEGTLFGIGIGSRALSNFQRGSCATHQIFPVGMASTFVQRSSQSLDGRLRWKAMPMLPH
jgi:predicted NBD/HSP70 family sugar kinase